MMFYPLVAYPRQDTTSTTVGDPLVIYLPCFVYAYIISLFLFAEGYWMSESKTGVEELTALIYRIQLIG